MKMNIVALVTILFSVNLLAQTSHFVNEEDLVHKSSGLKISSTSDMNGICYYFNFDSYLEGSARSKRVDFLDSQETIVLNHNARPVKQERSIDILEKITCLKN